MGTMGACHSPAKPLADSTSPAGYDGHALDSHLSPSSGGGMLGFAPNHDGVSEPLSVLMLLPRVRAQLVESQGWLSPMFYLRQEPRASGS